MIVDQFEERPELPCGDAGTPVPRAAPEAQPSGGFTPGPWEWACGLVPPDGPERYADIYKDGGDLIIAQFNDLIPEGKANARLIAAAPDLLTELKTAVYAEERTSSGVYVQDIDRWLERARAAIAKAEGRS